MHTYSCLLVTCITNTAAPSFVSSTVVFNLDGTIESPGDSGKSTMPEFSPRSATPESEAVG